MKSQFYLFFLLVLIFPYFGESQDIQAIIDAQEIDTMLYSGSKDNRINWVIQNRGNSFSNKETFTNAYRNDLLKAFDQNDQLAQSPYAQYRNFFNLYTSWWPDALDDSNGWSWNILKQTRDAKFLPWSNDSTGWVTWFSSTAGGGGGGAGLERDRRVGDGKMYGMGYETFLHEFGHTMPGLLDEYSSDASWSGGQCWETGNTSGQLSREEIPWRNWIDEDTPIPTPYTDEYLNKYGAFEGAMTNYFQCHRPSARSCFMGAGGFGEDFGLSLCSVCKQRVICYLYKYVNVIENPSPSNPVINIDNNNEITFSVNVVKPEPNTQTTAWVLNGKTIAQNTESITLDFDACQSYELKFTVLDENPLIRYDPKFDHIYPKPYQEHIWLIHNDDAQTAEISSNEIVVNSDCSLESTGTVQFNISGGTAPYTINLEDTDVPNPVVGLSQGLYNFDIVDANGCGITKQVEIESDLYLNPTICSNVDANGWMLKVEEKNYDTSELSYLWSNGNTNTEISISQSGIYEVTVTNTTGCTATDRIEVFFDDAKLTVTETVIPTYINTPSGRIYLDISGGRSPYTIFWEDKVNTELTDTNLDHIISSGDTWGHLPEYAFDNDRSTKWLHAVSNEAYIGYLFDQVTQVESYIITSADDVPERDPKNWEFQGSIDGQNWETIDVQSDHLFENRYQEKAFLLANPASFSHYRLFVIDNYGDIATQIQELELLGIDNSSQFNPNKKVEGYRNRFSLNSGNYRYIVKDENGSSISNTVTINSIKPTEYSNLDVDINGSCEVFVKNPKTTHEYYWFKDKQLSNLIHKGDSFRPNNSSNYYVAAVDKTTYELNNNTRGFSVEITSMPEVDTINNDEFSILNPLVDEEYYWYDELSCGSPLHIGTSFKPTEDGDYFVTANHKPVFIDPIDPLSVDGMLIRMDASDINGDGLRDESIPNGEGYDWIFTPDNGMTADGWFAYRSNYQNGLGVADFATIWLQRIEESVSGYQTIIMAYQENPISFGETAPFESLSGDIPKNKDGTQIYSNNAPDRTKNGSTYVNGVLVDPFATPNEMEFIILATVMTEPSTRDVYYTDTHWEGKVGEILLYDRALSELEIKGISAYLKEKWLSLGTLESKPVTFNWSETVSTFEENNEVKPKIYPNPTDDRIHITNVNINSLVEIFTQDGRSIYKNIALTNDITFLINNYPSGVYFVRIFDEIAKRMYVEKLVKK